MYEFVALSVCLIVFFVALVALGRVALPEDLPAAPLPGRGPSVSPLGDTASGSLDLVAMVVVESGDTGRLTPPSLAPYEAEVPRSEWFYPTELRGSDADEAVAFRGPGPSSVQVPGGEVHS